MRDPSVAGRFVGRIGACALAGVALAAALAACASTKSAEETALGSMKEAMEAARRGDAERATALAHQAADERPGFVDPWFLLAALAERRGAFDDARAAYTRVLELDPTRTAAGIALAQTYIAERRPAEAREWLIRAVESDPGAEPAMFNLGALADESGRPDEAAGWYRLSATLDGRDPRAPAALAKALVALGRKDEARAALDEAKRRAR